MTGLEQKVLEQWGRGLLINGYAPAKGEDRGMLCRTSVF